MNASTNKMVIALKDCDQDHEWYPTTKDMINAIKQDYNKQNDNDESSPSVLDCGAGDGRVLNGLTNGNKYAIEKARPLLNALDSDIFVVGTDFDEQTLIDKKADIVFSNPPYSEFERWAVKIIREANAGYIYLILPVRWLHSVEIGETIKLREGEASVIKSLDFNDAERKARAKVDIIRIRLRDKHRYSRGDIPTTDPFIIWFEENFKLDINNEETSKYDYEHRAKEKLNDCINNELVEGTSLVNSLESFYQRDIKNLLNTYQSLCDVDADVLKQLDVNISAVRKGLQYKI